MKNESTTASNEVKTELTVYVLKQWGLKEIFSNEISQTFRRKNNFEDIEVTLERESQNGLLRIERNGKVTNKIYETRPALVSALAMYLHSGKIEEED